MVRRGREAALIMIAVCAIAAFFSYAQAEETNKLKYMRGRIGGIDFAGSKIVVQRLYGSIRLFEDNVVFHVPNNVLVVTNRQRIFNKLRPIGFVDLIKGDHVVIAYHAGEKGAMPAAVRIEVMDHDRPVPP